MPNNQKTFVYREFEMESANLLYSHYKNVEPNRLILVNFTRISNVIGSESVIIEMDK